MSEYDACVVDASVAIKLFIEEPLSEQAHGLFGRLADPSPIRLYAPDLLYIECANILWKAVTRWGMPAYDAAVALSQLQQLLLDVTSTADLAGEALALAVANHITAYDACYVALARQLGAPLVTADKPLVTAMGAAQPPVVWLGDL